MLKKFNTKSLLIIFAVLATVVIITMVFDDKKGSRTFKDVLLTVDTSTVTAIYIYPSAEKHKEIKLLRNNGQWTVQNESISFNADTSYVSNLLQTFYEIKPQRLAATDESRWKDYNVDDSLGNRIKFLSGEKTVADIVVGKFSYNQQSRAGISYLKLADEKDVYAVEGFIPMLINQPFNEWRNKSIIRGNKEDWTKLSFSYPDSSFTLRKENGKWMINSGSSLPYEVDSLKLEQYLNELSFMSNSGFVDNAPASPVPSMSLTIEGNNMAAPVTVKAFQADSTMQYLINSSYNPESWFSGANGNLSGRIFKKLPDLIIVPVAEENGKS